MVYVMSFLTRFQREELTVIQTPAGTDVIAVRAWLVERRLWDGGHYDDWGHTVAGHRNYAFYPGQEKNAMMFKLAWGGK